MQLRFIPYTRTDLEKVFRYISTPLNLFLTLMSFLRQYSHIHLILGYNIFLFVSLQHFLTAT